MNGRRGVSLVEVIVALLILAVGWGGLVALHQLSVRSLVGARLVEEARWTLQATADSVEALGGPTSGRRDLVWGWVEWATSEGGVLLQARSASDSAIAAFWVAGGGVR